MKIQILFTALVVGAFASPAIAANEALLIFAGEGHKTFLGCLNCSKYDEAAICNKYGTYGSKYADRSIWNKYGTFGGQYNQYSPFIHYTESPPVIVDNDGASMNTWLPTSTKTSGPV